MEYKIKFKNGFKMTTTDGIEAFAAEFAELRNIEDEDIQSYCEVCAQVCYEDETEGGTPYGHICDWVADNWEFIKTHKDEIYYSDLAYCHALDNDIESVLEKD